MPDWMEDGTFFVKKYLEWESGSGIAQDETKTAAYQETAARNAANAAAAEAGVPVAGQGTGTTVNIYGISDEEAERLLSSYINPTRI